MNLLNTTADSEKIHTTSEYKMFSFKLGNRDVDNKHVLNLAVHIEEKDLEIPIIVNEKMEVCDGQHRLKACELANKPVKYIIKAGLELDDIRKLNSTSKKWEMRDYMLSFVKLGNKEYEILKWFHETYKFSITISMVMLNGKGWTSSADHQEFKQGFFKVKDLEQAKLVAERLIYVSDYFEYYRKNSFIMAMIYVLFDPAFDWEIFKARLKNFSSKLKNQGSREDFILNIERLYNHHTSADKRIRLRTHQERYINKSSERGRLK
tara:strand:- start:166 stop:957 length:792 start_codon:yes stop_codon:yes gene_type:complete